MNAANNDSFKDDAGLEYSAPFRRGETEEERKNRRPTHIRTGRPTGFNGKHRRRNKRYSF